MSRFVKLAVMPAVLLVGSLFVGSSEAKAGWGCYSPPPCYTPPCYTPPCYRPPCYTPPCYSGGYGHGGYDHGGHGHGGSIHVHGRRASFGFHW